MVVGIYDTAANTLYAARGRLIPFNSNSPTGSTFTACSTLHEHSLEARSLLVFTRFYRDRDYERDDRRIERSMGPIAKY